MYLPKDNIIKDSLLSQSDVETASIGMTQMRTWEDKQNVFPEGIWNPSFSE